MVTFGKYSHILYYMCIAITADVGLRGGCYLSTEPLAGLRGWSPFGTNPIGGALLSCPLANCRAEATARLEASPTQCILFFKKKHPVYTENQALGRHIQPRPTISPELLLFDLFTTTSRVAGWQCSLIKIHLKIQTCLGNSVV